MKKVFVCGGGKRGNERKERKFSEPTNRSKASHMKKSLIKISRIFFEMSSERDVH
jgi:hypothetical protein